MNAVAAYTNQLYASTFEAPWASSASWTPSMWWSSSSATRAAAPPPTPLNSATICGICVICTLRAPNAPPAVPIAIAPMISGTWSRWST